MTKKHYNSIANILRNLRPIKSDLETVNGFEIRDSEYRELVKKLSDYFVEDNFNFRAHKFIKAIYSLTI